MTNTAKDDISSQWAIFDRSGRLACLPIMRQNPNSITVSDGTKVPRQRLWMISDVDCAPLLPAARTHSANLDIENLWQLANDESLLIVELSKRAAAHEKIEMLAVLQTVLDNPAYFRRNEGQFMPAPEDAIKKVRAALQRRAIDAQNERAILAALSNNELPAELVQNRVELLAGENKNTVVYRAVKKAAGGERYITEWLVKVGIFANVRECWDALFLHYWQQPIPTPLDAVRDDLPLADAHAFSIDEAGTFEVDDAFSVTPQEEGALIGIHIAVPALDDKLFDEDVYKNHRLTSVYFPNAKHPMLSAEHIDAYSLKSGDYRPVLSLYCHFNVATGVIGEPQTKLERVFIDDNYSLEDFAAATPPKVKNEYQVLSDFAAALRQTPPKEQIDYRIISEPPQVIAYTRPPVSYTIEALMRHANIIWGEQLASKKAGGLFRSGGMTTLHPEAGNTYAWTSSPLRRMIDLFNQRLLLSLSGHTSPPKVHWRTLARAFDSAKTDARRNQDTMERHEILRALQCLPPNTVLYGEAQKKNKIRLRDYPLSGKIMVSKHSPAENEEIQVCLHEINFFTQEAKFVFV